MSRDVPGALSKLQSRSVRAKMTQDTVSGHAQRHIRRTGANEIICHLFSSVKKTRPTHQATSHAQSYPCEQRLLHHDDQAPRTLQIHPGVDMKL